MADDFNLPPDTQDFDLNVTLHAVAMPYVTDWYQDKKKAGETPEQFLRRLIYRAALNHRASKIIGQLDTERQALEQSTLEGRTAVDSDYETAVSAIESL